MSGAVSCSLSSHKITAPRSRMNTGQENDRGYSAIVYVQAVNSVTVCIPIIKNKTQKLNFEQTAEAKKDHMCQLLIQA